MTWIPTRTPNNDESGGCDTGLANHRSSDDCSGLNLQTQYSGQILTQPCDEVTLVADALAIGSARELREAFAAFNGRMVFTPHHGEMAMLTGVEEDTIAQSPEKVARDVATQYRSVVVIKGRDTVIAAPDGTTLHYGGGGTGLATGGSGDVLAGAIGGLLSRGAPPIIAAGWGVWLHGQSGRRVATTSGPIGFLAREVSAEFPRLLPQGWRPVT